MNKKIAILRGINVAGKRKILMAELKQLFEKLDFNKVQTYIQSGNVLFEPTENIETNKLADIIEKAINQKFGFEVPVIVVSANELKLAVETNPYYQGNMDNDKLHLTLLKQVPPKEQADKLAGGAYMPDKYTLKGKNVFIYCEGKYHQSKLTNNFIERKLNVVATTRNWKTILKLLELASET